MFARRLRLDGRIAFITGGVRGIGLAGAVLCECGATSIIADADLLRSAGRAR